MGNDRRRAWRSRRVLMCPCGKGIHAERPLATLRLVTAPTQLVEHPLPGTVRRPTSVSHVDGLPPAVLLGQVAPRRARTGPPQHPIDHSTVILPTTPALGRTVRQQWLQQSPLRISQIVTINHTNDLSDPATKIQETRPKCRLQDVAVLHSCLNRCEEVAEPLISVPQASACYRS